MNCKKRRNVSHGSGGSPELAVTADGDSEAAQEPRSFTSFLAVNVSVSPLSSGFFASAGRQPYSRQVSPEVTASETTPNLLPIPACCRLRVC